MSQDLKTLFLHSLNVLALRFTSLYHLNIIMSSLDPLLYRTFCVELSSSFNLYTVNGTHVILNFHISKLKGWSHNE